MFQLLSSPSQIQTKTYVHMQANFPPSNNGLFPPVIGTTRLYQTIIVYGKPNKKDQTFIIKETALLSFQKLAVVNIAGTSKAV